MERDGKLMFLLLSGCLLERGDFIIFQTGDRLCHLDVEDCHKKKKKKILYNICLSLAQTDKKLVSPM